MTTTPAAPVEPAPGAPRILAAFSEPAFRLLWVNTFLFALVQSTQRFTFVWLVLELGRGADASGLVLFAIGLPVFLVVLPAGAMSDRVDRRLLLVSSQGGALLMTALTALLVGTDNASIPVTLALAFGLGAALAFGQPVRTAVLPSLVPRERLMNAIVLTTIGMNISMIAGPALGGAAIALWGLGGAFAAQAVLYAIGLVVLLPLKLPVVTDRPARRKLRVEIAEGMRFVGRHREIRALFVLLAASGILMLGPYQALMPKIARDQLGRDALGASLLFVFLGLGMACTSLWLAARRDLSNKGAWFAGFLVIGGLTQSALGLSTVYVLSAALMFFWGVGGGLYMNLNQTLIQSHTPNEVMGRVMSLHTLAMVGLSPIGALLGGVVATAAGAPATVAAAGVIMSVIAVIVLVRVDSIRTMS
ncbi:MAG TPA: MFS transporter [Acidimicrobiales bacterium]|nr:MFS transporter [Acidimicrobiales bacterium]